MLAFLLTCLLIELTPGPNMSWLAVLGVTHGRKSALAAVAGIALGLSIAGLVAGAGLSALISSQPVVFNGLRLAGAAYLLYLAYDTWKEADAEIPTKQSPALYFRHGLITNILNPKAYLFYAAILPQFIDVGQALISQVVTFTLLYIAVATAVHLAIAILAGTLAPFLANSARSQTIRRVMALCLVGIAIWFFFATEVSQ